MLGAERGAGLRLAGGGLLGGGGDGEDGEGEQRDGEGAHTSVNERCARVLPASFAERRRSSEGRMRRLAPLIALVLLAAPPAAHAAAGGVYARVTDKEVVLGNPLVERRWARDGLVTEALVDKRAGGRTWSAERRDFALQLPGGAELGSERFTVTSAKVAKLARGGLRVTMELASPLPGLTATR